MLGFGSARFFFFFFVFYGELSLRRTVPRRTVLEPFLICKGFLCVLYLFMRFLLVHFLSGRFFYVRASCMSVFYARTFYLCISYCLFLNLNIPTQKKITKPCHKIVSLSTLREKKTWKRNKKRENARENATISVVNVHKRSVINGNAN